jgi:hypothetical protein
MNKKSLWLGLLAATFLLPGVYAHGGGWSGGIDPGMGYGMMGDGTGMMDYGFGPSGTDTGPEGTGYFHCGGAGGMGHGPLGSLSVLTPEERSSLKERVGALIDRGAPLWEVMTEFHRSMTRSWYGQ